jgi:hypothetical protein
MKLRKLGVFAALIPLTQGLHAQTFRQQAAIVGGGDAGRCTVEIVVDGVAEVAIRGNDATVTNLKGQAPRLRRFECNAFLPPNPEDFRFRGISGRGSQNLMNPPLQGQPAVVRIEDPQNGEDRYVFELSWRRGGGPGFEPGPSTDRRDQRDGHRFTTDQAVEVCRSAVRTETQNRYRTGDVNFREIRIDDAPGRSDWVIGTLEARHPGRPDEILRFSCSVNFETGQVRSAQVDPMYAEGGGRPGLNPQAVQNCRRAVEDKVRHDGYDRVNFRNIAADDRPGRTDRIMGDFQAVGRDGPESLHFSCSVGARDGDVLSVDVTNRR